MDSVTHQTCPTRNASDPLGLAIALLICSLYNISSFRRLSSAIAENNAHRWFCSLTIDDPVFDHSTSSCFIERIGRDRSAGIFNGLNEELLRLGLLSPAYPPQERGPIIRVGLARVAEQPDPQGRGWTVCALEDAPEHPAGPADMGTDTATSTPGGQWPRGAEAGRGHTTGRRTRQSKPRQRGNHPRRQTPARHASRPGSAPPVSQMARQGQPAIGGILTNLRLRRL